MLKLVGIVVVLVSAALAVSGSQPTGTWKMSADAPDGKTYKATLVVMEQGGRLSASIDSPDLGVVPLQEVIFVNGEFSFKLPHPEAGYILFRLLPNGAIIQGMLETKAGEKGKVTGTRAGSESAVLAGTWKIVSKAATGSEMRLTLELSQSGSNVTGRLITENGDTVEIVEGQADGSQIRFKVVTNEGSYDVSGQASGNQLKGVYSTPGGGKGSFTAAKS